MTCEARPLSKGAAGAVARCGLRGGPRAARGHRQSLLPRAGGKESEAVGRGPQRCPVQVTALTPEMNQPQVVNRGGG